MKEINLTNKKKTKIFNKKFIILKRTLLFCYWCIYCIQAPDRVIVSINTNLHNNVNPTVKIISMAV